MHGEGAGESIKEIKDTPQAFRVNKLYSFRNPCAFVAEQERKAWTRFRQRKRPSSATTYVSSSPHTSFQPIPFVQGVEAAMKGVSATTESRQSKEDTKSTHYLPQTRYMYCN